MYGKLYVMVIFKDRKSLWGGFISYLLITCQEYATKTSFLRNCQSHITDHAVLCFWSPIFIMSIWHGNAICMLGIDKLFNNLKSHN